MIWNCNFHTQPKYDLFSSVLAKCIYKPNVYHLKKQITTFIKHTFHPKYYANCVTSYAYQNESILHSVRMSINSPNKCPNTCNWK